MFGLGGGKLLKICILCIISLKNIDVLGLKDSRTSDRHLNWVCVLVYVLVGGVVTCVAFSRSNLVWLMVLWVSCSWDWSWLFSLETSSNSWRTQTHAAVNNGLKRGKQMFLTSIWVLSADLLEILGVRASSLGAVIKPGETGRGQRSETLLSLRLCWQNEERLKIKQVEGYIHTWNSSVGLSVNREGSVNFIILSPVSKVIVRIVQFRVNV